MMPYNRKTLKTNFVPTSTYTFTRVRENSINSTSNDHDERRSSKDWALCNLPNLNLMEVFFKRMISQKCDI
uniref:Uncharacterized protein n=1 Tax=Lepeophtheirus salmonis TaxID=72036 RepID=A0A0K2USH7_LEPSM